MSKNIFRIIVPTILLSLFIVCVVSIRETSLTMDELAHLPAGYSYLVKQDMRLNPEHPPIIKDLSAIPLLFIKGINFPESVQAWQEDINGQWVFGNIFVFKSDNPANKMVFWSRIPMILVLIVGAYYVYLFGKEFWGEEVGTIALLLYSLSPTLIAHGRLVTTDVGIAVGTLISTFYLLKTLKQPSKKNVVLTGISFGFAFLAKFTGVFLVPYFIILVFLWIFLSGPSKKEWLNLVKTHGLNLLELQQCI
jgi:dolichyl-phosphate-mannose--protein O-mannosyl transferase